VSAHGLPDEARRPLPIVTPEGVPLRFHVAAAGDRLGAFLLDWLLTIALSVLLVVAGVIATGGEGDHPLWAFVLLGVFALQGFYFIVCEIRGRGTTPGKRRMGLRVMDAAGGPLTSGAVVVRNVMRTLEVQLPLAALLAPEALWPGAPGWARLLAGAWMLLIAGLPLFNRQRLRVGDLVAGTVVVVAPRARLLGDVAASRTAPEVVEEPRYAFTDAQLDVYGNFELQVLEDVLRGREHASRAREAQLAVAERIARKIGWREPVPAREAPEFLRAFYAALRARLEQKLLWGRSKKDKHG
jgi:uncharacterized RDD family membrane protein YckC